MKVFCTGRSGFIGSHLAGELFRLGHDVVRRIDEDADAVVHLSAKAGIRPDKQDAAGHYEINVAETLNLLEWCVAAKVKKFIYISSSSVYGTPARIPVVETDVTDRPLCHYAATKKTGELACHTYHVMYGLDVAVLRLFTVYGPGQTTDMAIPYFTRLIRSGEKVPVFGDGSTLRDYIYVGDAVDAIIGALTQDHGYQEYNIGSGIPFSIMEVVRHIEEYWGKEANIMYLPMPAGEAGDNYANIEKARRFWPGPKWKFWQGLQQYNKWLENNKV